MAKQHTITAVIIGIVVALGGVQAARAQMAYSNGYSDGYYGQFAPTASTDLSTEYGRGWHNGQIIAEDDLNRMMPHVGDDPSSAPGTNPYPPHWH